MGNKSSHSSTIISQSQHYRDLDARSALRAQYRTRINSPSYTNPALHTKENKWLIYRHCLLSDAAVGDVARCSTTPTRSRILPTTLQPIPQIGSLAHLIPIISHGFNFYIQVPHTTKGVVLDLGDSYGRTHLCVGCLGFHQSSSATIAIRLISLFIYFHTRVRVRGMIFATLQFLG